MIEKTKNCNSSKEGKFLEKTLGHLLRFSLKISTVLYFTRFYISVTMNCHKLLIIQNLQQSQKVIFKWHGCFGYILFLLSSYPLQISLFVTFPVGNHPNLFEWRTFWLTHCSWNIKPDNKHFHLKADNAFDKTSYKGVIFKLNQGRISYDLMRIWCYHFKF